MQRKYILLPAALLLLFLLLFLSYERSGVSSGASDSAFSTMDSQEIGAMDDAERSTDQVSAPVLSADSGFYDQAFDLTIASEEGMKIYYTTDSSMPTTESQLYKGSIRIEDPGDQANVYSARTDFEPYLPDNLTTYSYEGLSQVTEEDFEDYYCRYLLPECRVDKCVVIRAMAVDEDGNCSDVTTASYFIDYQNKTGYDNVAVISLVSDPEGLFSDDTGIMVNGATYKEKLASGQLDDLVTIHDIRAYTNSYSGRGKEWERETHIDYFDEDGQDLVFSQEIGLRLHGNQSRVGQAHKSFNLFAREEYDGEDTFGASFFEDGSLSDTVTLMRGNDVRYYYLSGLMNHRTMDTQNYRMVQVFLDGEYWGFYALTERYASNQYMKAHYDLDKGEYNILVGGPEGYTSKKGNEEAAETSFTLLKSYIADHDLSDSRVYDKVCSMMDMQSFIDCYAARLYTGDQDWSWYKNQCIMYYDHQWHWTIYDMDYGAGAHLTAQADTDTFTTSRLAPTQSLANDPFFPALMKNTQFCRDFINTYMDLANEVFSSTRLAEQGIEFMQKYWEATCRSVERYPMQGEAGKTDLTTRSNYYSRHFDVIQSYFEERFYYGSDYLKNYFGLQGDLAQVTIQTSGPAGSGRICLNTITPELDEDSGWSGSYFTDCPVTVTAQPAEGYTFVGWTCQGGEAADATAIRTTVSFKENVTITAVFAEETSAEQSQ